MLRADGFWNWRAVQKAVQFGDGGKYRLKHYTYAVFFRGYKLKRFNREVFVGKNTNIGCDFHRFLGDFFGR